VTDTQDERGYFADTAPHRWGRRPCDPQVNTPVSLPLLLYRTYGNRRAVAENFDRLKRYLFALAEESDRMMLSRTGFGEWACPKAECYDDPYGAGAVSMHVNPALVSTGYFYLSCTQMAEMARILGRGEDRVEFEAMAERVRDRYIQAFYRPDEGGFDTGSQSSNALSIDLGLAEPETVPAVVENIARDVRAKGVHMATGNMGTKALVELMAQRTSPSFGYMLDQGATSIWERWEADRDNNIMNSRNQPMLAASAVWFYKYLGGIRLAKDSAGGDRLVIEPHAPEKLSRVKASLGTHLGEARAEWARADGAFDLRLRLPFNTRAEVRIKAAYARDGATLRLDGAPAEATRDGDWWAVNAACGEYHFRLE
jgi:alpha-L-rhamnosidase